MVPFLACKRLWLQRGCSHATHSVFEGLLRGGVEYMLAMERRTKRRGFLRTGLHVTILI